MKALWASYRGKVQAAKHREGVRMNRTRDDYQKEVVELRDRVSLYEHALEKVAGEVGMDVNEFVAKLIDSMSIDFNRIKQLTERPAAEPMTEVVINPLADLSPEAQEQAIRDQRRNRPQGQARSRTG